MLPSLFLTQALLLIDIKVKSACTCTGSSDGIHWLAMVTFYECRVTDV